jgi:hypothetical protein
MPLRILTGAFGYGKTTIPEVAARIYSAASTVHHFDSIGTVLEVKIREHGSRKARIATNPRLVQIAKVEKPALIKGQMRKSSTPAACR